MMYKRTSKSGQGVLLLLSDYRVQVALVILATSLSYFLWLFFNTNRVSTDNAIVQCDVSDVVSEVSGIVEEIKFEDNSYVEAGDDIVHIESEMFAHNVAQRKAELDLVRASLRAALSQQELVEIGSQSEIVKLEASVSAERSELISIGFSVEEERSKLKSANSDFDFYEVDVERYHSLKQSNNLSKRQYDEAKKVFDQALQAKMGLQSKIKSLQSDLDTQKHKVKAVEAEYLRIQRSQSTVLAAADFNAQVTEHNVSVAQVVLNKALTELSRTKIRAKRAGHISNRRVAKGQFVEIGQPIARIVSCSEEVWVEANFKESQIGEMKKGQRVTLTIDGYPGREFQGQVASISYGSGSTFSVLPPENATGNFTKVVQRFPVKIGFIDDNNMTLRAGMSVVASVYFE